MGEAEDHGALSPRAAFIVLAAIVAAGVLFSAVARPAVERGGPEELAAVVGVLAAILLVERWLRGR